MTPRKSFLLRIDPGLWAEVESWAQDEFRSVNGQIEFVLQQAVQRRKGRPSPEAVPQSVPPVMASAPPQRVRTPLSPESSSSNSGSAPGDLDLGCQD